MLVRFPRVKLLQHISYCSNKNNQLLECAITSFFLFHHSLRSCSPFSIKLSTAANSSQLSRLTLLLLPKHFSGREIQLQHHASATFNTLAGCKKLMRYQGINCLSKPHHTSKEDSGSDGVWNERLMLLQCNYDPTMSPYALLMAYGNICVQGLTLRLQRGSSYKYVVGQSFRAAWEACFVHPCGNNSGELTNISERRSPV